MTKTARKRDAERVRKNSDMGFESKAKALLNFEIYTEHTYVYVHSSDLRTEPVMKLILDKEEDGYESYYNYENEHGEH